MSAGARIRFPTRSPGDLRTVFALTIWSGITLIAAVLISRRVGGAFRSDIGSSAPCLVATLAFLLSMAANALWCTVNPSASVRKQIVAGAVTLVPPFALAAALWTSPSAFVGGYLAALLVLSVLATIAIRDLAPSPANDMRQVSASSPVADGRAGHPPRAETPKASCPLIAVADASMPIDETVDEEAGEGDPSILQWMTRRQLPEGGETVEGSVRIHFGAGERSAVAHVSFIPPLPDLPRAECQVLVDFEGRVRIGMAQAYGLRIEARRPESGLKATSIDVGFSAQARAVQNAAA
jgi:hypothetical protein